MLALLSYKYRVSRHTLHLSATLGIVHFYGHHALAPYELVNSQFNISDMLNLSWVNGPVYATSALILMPE